MYFIKMMRLNTINISKACREMSTQSTIKMINYNYLSKQNGTMNNDAYRLMVVSLIYAYRLMVVSLIHQFRHTARAEIISLHKQQ